MKILDSLPILLMVRCRCNNFVTLFDFLYRNSDKSVLYGKEEWKQERQLSFIGEGCQLDVF